MQPPAMWLLMGLMGVFGAATALGGGLAPLIVIPIQRDHGWRASFFIWIVAIAIMAARPEVNIGIENYTPLALFAVDPQAVMVGADTPFKSLRDLAEAARKQPDTIVCAITNPLGSGRMVIHMLEKLAPGAKFRYVTFKGGGEAFTALIGRHLDVYGDPGFGAQVRGGKARLLATFTQEPLKSYPGVPTVKASGFDITIDSPMGLVAPKNLPPAIAAKLAAAFRKASADVAHQNQLDSFDMQPNLMTGEVYTAYARTAYERDAKMLKDIGFKLE